MLKKNRKKPIKVYLLDLCPKWRCQRLILKVLKISVFRDRHRRQLQVPVHLATFALDDQPLCSISPANLSNGKTIRFLFTDAHIQYGCFETCMKLSKQKDRFCCMVMQSVSDGSLNGQKPRDCALNTFLNVQCNRIQ